MTKEEINNLFNNGNPDTCRICGKPSVSNFYRACGNKHRIQASEEFIGKVKIACKMLPKVIIRITN